MSSNSSSGGGCGCITIVLFIFLMFAIFGSIPTPWGKFSIDILPPAIYLEK